MIGESMRIRSNRSFEVDDRVPTTAERFRVGRGRRAALHTHGTDGTKSRLVALPVLTVVWTLIVLGWPAAASDEAPGSDIGLPAAAANSVGYVPYLSMGMGVVRSKDTRFVDAGDAGHAALYGTGDVFDAGAIDDGLQGHLAAGLRWTSGVRAQLELGLASALDYRGHTNYRGAGERQPSEARLDARRLLLCGFYDFPGWRLASGRTARPFLGAGVGVIGYRLSRYVQRFPDPDNPNGYLRRGPGGEVPLTAIPGGSGRNFIWMLATGVAIPIREGIHLDLSYRYTDAGETRTDVGDITIVRYRNDGTRREIPVTINETSAEFRTHSLLATLRFDW